MVDGADDDGSALGGAYTLRVEEACFPQCEGKTCGDDGCGRTCGACVYPADLCDGQGVCQEPTQAAGYSVESALVVGELPFTAESDTSLSSNHHWAADGECPGYVMKGRYSFDEVWRVVVPESGLLKLTAAPVDFDMWLSVWKKGEVGSVVCFAATDGQLDETLVVEAEPGSEVFIVVDGVSNKQNDAGPYTLTVQSLD